MRGFRPLVGLSAVLLLAGGCVSHRYSTLPELGENFEERQAKLSPFDHWQLQGRIAVRSADDGFTASLRWLQEGREIDARLHGPFGVGAVHLDGNERRLILERGNGETDVLRNPERALRERFGWTVPVGSFRYWVLGIQDPRSEAELTIDDKGLLRSLSQDGWDVTYRDYQQVAAAQLPRKLVARSGDIKLTVVVKDWRIPY